MKAMWEILVPTTRPPKIMTKGRKGLYFSTRYHRVWDGKVRKITGGLTVLQPVKGQWHAPDGELFRERMIPVRIMATRAEIEKIIDMTIEYYGQKAVMCYMVGSEVILRYA